MLKFRENGIISKRIFEFEGIINGIFTFRNDFSFACKSAEMMSCVAVVGFYNVSM